MKTPHILILTAMLAAASSAGLQAAQKMTQPNDARVQVSFLEPQNFTDFRDSEMGYSPKNGYAEELRDRIATQARYYLPAGHTLEVTFTDIDMAGDFEGWRGANWSDVRIVREIYVPRLAFSFRLKDAAGNVVKEGQRNLRDDIFARRINLVSRQDTLHYEKEMLDEWLRSEFPRVAKS